MKNKIETLLKKTDVLVDTGVNDACLKYIRNEIESIQKEIDKIEKEQNEKKIFRKPLDEQSPKIIQNNMNKKEFTTNSYEFERRKNQNKMIVDFMEDLSKYDNDVDLNLYYQNKYIDLDYHISWDMLMPVIEKIERITKNGVWIQTNDDQTYSVIIWPPKKDDEKSQKPLIEINDYEGTKIESVWMSVVKFIKWYNNQKNKILDI